jgi:hypothetical protein
VAKPRLLLSSAKVEALIHAAQHDCEPAVPMIQRGAMTIMERRGIRNVDYRQRCGGQPPQLDQQGRTVPRSTPNRVVQSTDANSAGLVLRLTDMDSLGNETSHGKQPSGSTIGLIPKGIFTAARLFGWPRIAT